MEKRRIPVVDIDVGVWHDGYTPAEYSDTLERKFDVRLVPVADVEGTMESEGTD